MGSINFKVPDDLLEVWKNYRLEHPKLNASDHFRATMVNIMVNGIEE